jgi:hypothetical protein
MKKTLCLRLTINDGKPVVAGADDLSVLTAVVTLVGRLGPRTIGAKASGSEIDVRLTGLTARPGDEQDEHLEWLRLRRLGTGDRVLIEVLDDVKPGKVVSQTLSHGKTGALGERAFYEEAKSIYFELKKKYEPDA